MIKGLRKAHSDQRGATLVEFAIVLPLLLLLMLGILDFGKAFNYWITETQVASEGARLAAVNYTPSGGESLTDYVKDQIQVKELHNDASVFICFPETNAVGNPVQITVRTDYNWLPVLKRFGGLGDITVQAQATMRLEAVSTQTESCPT